jgi:hypothetical protein
LTQRSFRRRTFLGAALVLPAGGCADMSKLFNPKPKYTLTSRGDRLVRWLQHDGHDVMMAPDALTVMGITNEGRDIPARQLAEGDPDDRYVISLINIRKIHEFVLHHRTAERTGDVLIFHNCDTKFERLASVRYPRNGKPLFITDTAFAEADFQKQLAFWFERMPGR